LKSVFVTVESELSVEKKAEKCPNEKKTQFNLYPVLNHYRNVLLINQLDTKTRQSA